MEQHNIKVTLTAHVFNDWSDPQKSFFFIKGIITNLVDNFLANISRSAALCDEFSAAERHVADFFVIIKSRDPGSNHNTSGIETD